MGEIVVKRAVDRSKYPKAMMYVDKQGNICKADRPQPLSPEEKASRQEARDAKYKAFASEKRKLKEAMQKAKKTARQKPSVENAEVFEVAVTAYNDFRKRSWRD